MCVGRKQRNLCSIINYLLVLQVCANLLVLRPIQYLREEICHLRLPSRQKNNRESGHVHRSMPIHQKNITHHHSRDREYQKSIIINRSRLLPIHIDFPSYAALRPSTRASAHMLIVPGPTGHRLHAVPGEPIRSRASRRYDRCSPPFYTTPVLREPSSSRPPSLPHVTPFTHALTHTFTPYARAHALTHMHANPPRRNPLARAYRARVVAPPHAGSV